MVEGTYIFDCEVFAHDWLFVFKEVATGEYTVIWNDNDEVLAFMERNPYLGGFNNKHYDNHILKAVMCGFTPEQVKEINDLIIVHELNGWDIPALREYRVYFDSFDLKDDCQDGISLKGIEAHLGIPIEETEVDFNVDHVLSESEKAQTTYYCKYDVDATEILFKLRQGYLDNKAAVGRKRGLTDRQAMTERMVYGCPVHSPMGDGQKDPWSAMHNYTVEKSQLPLFALNPAAIATRYDYWLRDVVTAAAFAYVNNYGNAGNLNASYSRGVRPAFCIC